MFRSVYSVIHIFLFRMSFFFFIISSIICCIFHLCFLCKSCICLIILWLPLSRTQIIFNVKFTSVLFCLFCFLLFDVFLYCYIVLFLFFHRYFMRVQVIRYFLKVFTSRITVLFRGNYAPISWISGYFFQSLEFQLFQFKHFFLLMRISNTKRFKSRQISNKLYLTVSYKMYKTLFWCGKIALFLGI